MSANTTVPSAAAPPVMVPVSTLEAIIQPSLHSLMIGHTFLTLLLPLLVALFYYSTPSSRRQPIFILNVAVIILAFVAGVMIDSLAIHSVLSPLSPWAPSVNIAIGIIGAFQSIVVDIILLVRLISVRPLSHLGPQKFMLMITLPVLLNLLRVINMFIFTGVLVNASRGPLGAENVAVVWATTPYLKIEWTSQMADNTYVSTMFMWAIRPQKPRQGVTSHISPNRVTFARRMRTLFRIALSNFVIPTIFSIAQLIVVYRDVNVVAVNDIVLVNSMLAVFGVVFATVWAGSVRRESSNWGEFNPEGSKTGTSSPPASRERGKKFAIPGLGSWKVASQPPELTLGSTALSISPTDTKKHNVFVDEGSPTETSAFRVKMGAVDEVATV